MSNSLPSVPYPSNEPIKSYAPGSVEKKEVLSTYKNLYNTSIEIKMRIGNKMSSLIIKLQFTHLMTINIKLVSIIDQIKNILNKQLNLH